AAGEEVLYQMAAAVGGTIEGAGVALGAELGDGVADTTPPQARPATAPGGPLVAGRTAGADAGSATPRSPDGAAVHQRLEHGRLALLVGREQDGQRLAVPLGLEVHLGREAALAPPQRLGRRVPPPFG